MLNIKKAPRKEEINSARTGWLTHQNRKFCLVWKVVALRWQKPRRSCLNTYHSRLHLAAWVSVCVGVGRREPAHWPLLNRNSATLQWKIPCSKSHCLILSKGSLTQQRGQTWVYINVNNNFSQLSFEDQSINTCKCREQFLAYRKHSLKVSYFYCASTLTLIVYLNWRIPSKF